MPCTTKSPVSFMDLFFLAFFLLRQKANSFTLGIVGCIIFV